MEVFNSVLSTDWIPTQRSRLRIQRLASKIFSSWELLPAMDSVVSN